MKTETIIAVVAIVASISGGVITAALSVASLPPRVTKLESGFEAQSRKLDSHDKKLTKILCAVAPKECLSGE